MKSPFPGMDPFIEECGLFEDFHQKLIGEIERDLANRLPEHYVVRTGERAYVVLAERDEKKENAFSPDVAVVGAAHQTPKTTGVALVDPNVEAEAVSMRAFVSTEFRETFIEIYTTEPARDLVACIEILSPSNKRSGSKGQKVYLRKRQGLLMGSAHFVEMDLLRGGARMPMLDPWPNSPYSVLVARRMSAPNCRVWPAHFSRQMPVVPIPLIHPDPDVPLDLQPMIDAIYARSRYHRDIDYTRPLTPPLSDEENAWLAEQLRQRSAPVS